MFPRRQRLPRADFAEGLRGKRLSSPHFSVVVPFEARGYAVVVPKKAVRLSARRHLLKRRVLSALRTLPLPQALIVFPKSSALGLPHAELHAELAGLLSKIARTP